MTLSKWMPQNLPGSYPDYDDDSPQRTVQSEFCPGTPKVTKAMQGSPEDVAGVQKQREHLERQLDSHKSKIKDLSKTLGSCNEEVELSRMGQLCAEEKFRRQTEILRERNAALDASLEENNSLIVQQAALQRWTDRLDDDEARQITVQLYHDLETWVKRHFPHLFLQTKPHMLTPIVHLLTEMAVWIHSTTPILLYHTASLINS
ncbi:hypothetical protein N7494_007099 [Penicillium frequentans]|uniref:Uncharacterized protein n=1 Tax=Penicillium frequentans TaxID=3151616 RepID=A0AAD6CRW5_9EURO|nr:hypothetical protein N7494_007099 [Penicillium glabrum]